MSAQLNAVLVRCPNPDGTETKLYLTPDNMHIPAWVKECDQQELMKALGLAWQTTFEMRCERARIIACRERGN